MAKRGRRVGPGGQVVIVDFTPEYMRSARTELEKAIAKSGILVQTEAIRLVTRHAGPTKTAPDRPSSSPGQPPHTRTGTLSRSIQMETLQRGRNKFVARVGSTGTGKGYALYLEVGTRKMFPRPYLRPALRSMRPKIIRLIKAAGGRFKGG